jgi:murein tripeptide amidase MpaA
VIAIALAAFAASGAAQQAVLPPEQAWRGRSESLVAAAGDPWITPAEKSGFARTPSYDETLAWLRRLAQAAPQVKLLTLGRTPEGRDLWMAVVSREGASTPAAARAGGRAVILAQAGIHAGEIDGKDAGLMLLRDMTVGGSRRALLETATLLFVPIFNADGHERSSAFSRINQRGPAEAGWRTTARNLNLNRDYAKLDAPETRAMVAAINAWAPDLYVDLHVTDGIDHRYDVTFGHNTARAWSPSIGAWLDSVLMPHAVAALKGMGHHPGPLAAAFAMDEFDLGKGIQEDIAGARFSTGYGDARHLPTLLVESHSLKPYRQRVLGSYVLLESTLELVGRKAPALRAAVAEDLARRAPRVPLDFVLPASTSEEIEYEGVEQRVEPSAVTGNRRVVYTGRPWTGRVPVFRGQAKTWATRPRAYWVPAAWSDVIERLALHGISLERLSAAREVDVVMDRLHDPKLATTPFEGRVAVTAAATPERRRERFPAGSVRVSTDQPLGDLAVLLLDPASPDSFFQWGFFQEALQPTEYVENYVMEPMAARMLAEDAALRAEFQRKLEQDAAFAASPAQRLQWFYRRTPFYDDRALLYPVAREE